MAIIFDKYEYMGAYHWACYKNQDIYGQHANFVKEWVRKGHTLDIGAGDGLITSLIKAIGIDDNRIAVKLAQEKGVNVNLGSAYKLEFKDKVFDNVFMGDVIEHLEFPEKSLTEVSRVLKDDGIFYVCTPPKRKDGKLWDKYHYQEWTINSLKKFMEKNGFKTVGNQYIKYVRIYVKFKKNK